MLFFEFSNIVRTEESSVVWCQLNGLLNVLPSCSKCGNTMEVFPIEGSKEENFRCTKRSCMTHSSSRSNTIFHQSRMEIRVLLSILYFWCIEISITKASLILNVPLATISEWYQKMREKAEIFLSAKSDGKLGGKGYIVEIDEALISRRKFNRGRIQQSQIWIFGGTVRGKSDECFIEIVPNKTRETLLEILKRRLHPETIVSTDGWKAYENLPTLIPELCVEQLTVNHTEHFVNPENKDAHTQTIEGFWSHLKRKLRQKGQFKRSRLVKYFAEHIYRKKSPEDVFEQFINDVNEFY